MEEGNKIDMHPKSHTLLRCIFYVKSVLYSFVLFKKGP